MQRERKTRGRLQHFVPMNVFSLEQILHVFVEETPAIGAGTVVVNKANLVPASQSKHQTQNLAGVS